MPMPVTASLMASKARRVNALKLKAIAQTWPTDPFRPNMQLKTFFDSLAEHPKLTSNAVLATQALKDDVLKEKVKAYRIP